MVKRIELKGEQGLEFITICANCEAIKEDNLECCQLKDEKWFHIEEDSEVWYKIAFEYFNSKNKGVSHGICYACAKKLYPEYYY